MSFVHRSKHICPQLLLGGLFYFYGFFTAGLWAGGWREGMSAGGACEDDELVRDPFCGFPSYSQVLIPSAKAVLNADAPLASWIFPFLEPGRGNDCVLAVHKHPVCHGTLESAPGEGDAEVMPARTEGSVWGADFWVIGRNKAQVAQTFPCYANAEEKTFASEIVQGWECRRGPTRSAAARITLGEIRELSLLLISNPTRAQLPLFKARRTAWSRLPMSDHSQN